MESFDKKLKGGLKKCPLHKFGAGYRLMKDGWYQCSKCKMFHKLPDGIDREKLIGIKKSLISKKVIYELEDYYATII